MAIIPINKIYKFDKDRHIKSIIDFTGKYYYIDELGNLYYRNTLLKSDVNQYGYIGNTLKDVNGKSCYVLRHQIVAQCFLINEYQDGYTVDHIDRNKINNKLENLRWANQKEQIQNQNRRIVTNKVKNDVYTNNQFFVQRIKDIKKYFIENTIPKFNKGHYFVLTRLYDLYDILTNGFIEDEIMNSYIVEYMSSCNSLDEMTNRENFYDKLYDKAKQYKCDYSMNLAQKCTENSLNTELFEELFLDKPYKKSTFKEECIKHFVLKDEIFKNQATINAWLNKVGYIIRKTRTGHIIRKL